MELDSKFNEGRPRSDMSVCLHVGGDLVRESCEDSRLVSKSDMPKSLNKQLSTSHAWHLQAPAACMELSSTLGLWLLLSRPLPEAEDRVEKKLGRSILPHATTLFSSYSIYSSSKIPHVSWQLLLKDSWRLQLGQPTYTVRFNQDNFHHVQTAVFGVSIRFSSAKGAKLLQPWTILGWTPAPIRSGCSAYCCIYLPCFPRFHSRNWEILGAKVGNAAQDLMQMDWFPVPWRDLEDWNSME